jgi:hypothetical protein
MKRETSYQLKLPKGTELESPTSRRVDVGYIYRVTIAGDDEVTKAELYGNNLRTLYNKVKRAVQQYAVALRHCGNGPKPRLLQGARPESLKFECVEVIRVDGQVFPLASFLIWFTQDDDAVYFDGDEEMYLSFPKEYRKAWA